MSRFIAYIKNFVLIFVQFISFGYYTLLEIYFYLRRRITVYFSMCGNYLFGVLKRIFSDFSTILLSQNHTAANF